MVGYIPVLEQDFLNDLNMYVTLPLDEELHILCQVHQKTCGLIIITNNVVISQ